MNKDFWAHSLLPDLYRERLLQTPWNTTDSEFSRKGWTLKNGLWAPWFINLRLFGNSPQVFAKVCRAMADLVRDHLNDIDILIGVEMAGIPLVGGTVQALMDHYVEPVRFGYTRPLPKKVRTPGEAIVELSKLTKDVAGYGQKSYVEGVLREGDRVAIFDDMSTGLASKIISRSIVLWEARQKAVNLGGCQKILYFLNRDAENKKTGIKFQNAMEELCPAVLDVDYVIEFDEHLPLLKKVMRDSEYTLLRDYQKDPGYFQNEATQKEILAQVAKDLELVVA